MTGPCQICGKFDSRWGFWNGADYLFFCFTHRDQGEPVEKVFPPRLENPTMGQMELDLGIKRKDKRSEFDDFRRGGAWPFTTLFSRWIIIMVDPGEEAIAETWYRRARPLIGSASNDHQIGATINRLIKEGYLEDADGKRGTPVGLRAKGSQQPMRRRTNKR